MKFKKIIYGLYGFAGIIAFHNMMDWNWLAPLGEMAVNTVNMLVPWIAVTGGINYLGSAFRKDNKDLLSLTKMK